MPAESRNARVTRWWMALPLCLVVAGFVAFGYRHRSAPPPIEVERSALVLREGKLCLTNKGIPFSGFLVQHYPGGQLQSRSALKDGLLEGVSQGFYTNGVMQVSEHFKQGTSHGKREKWFPGGAKMSEALIENGKLVGEFRRWHENGHLAEEVHMSAGVPNGNSSAWYPSGYIKAEARHENGILLTQKFWKDGEGARLPASNPIKG